MPVELLFRLVGLGVTDCDVACSARCDLEWNGSAGSPLKSLNHLQHAVAGSGAKVDSMPPGRTLEIIERGFVPFGKIHHMDVIAHAGAVLGVIVITKYIKLRQPTACDLGDAGHQVVGDVVGIFANEAAIVGADWVEVAQAGDVPVGI